MTESLTATMEIGIRFSETDAMGVVWHGNYLKYFEDGREDFGEKFDLPYLKVAGEGFFIPIVHSAIDFKSPVFYGNRIRVITRYVPTRTAKIVFHYEVVNLTSGELAATGTTTQVFITQEKRELELVMPPFYRDWKEAHGV